MRRVPPRGHAPAASIKFQLIPHHHDNERLNTRRSKGRPGDQNRWSALVSLMTANRSSLGMGSSSVRARTYLQVKVELNVQVSSIWVEYMGFEYRAASKNVPMNALVMRSNSRISETYTHCKCKS